MTGADVDVTELHALLAAPIGQIVLVDVREPDEFETVRVPGAALVPLATVPDALPTLPTDRPVYVICHSGGRSQRAADWLLAQGVQAVNVAGGTSAWVQAGFLVESGPTESGPVDTGPVDTAPASPTA